LSDYEYDVADVGVVPSLNSTLYSSTAMVDRRILEHLGVSANEEELYRFFLRNPDSDIDAAGAELALDRDAIDAAHQGLKRHGLVRDADDRAIVAADPVAAIEKLIETRMEALNEELRNVSGVRAALPTLIEDQQVGRLSATPSDIERIDGLDEIRAHLDDLAFFAHREVMALQPDGPLSADYIEAARPLDMRCLRRGVIMRTVILREAIEDERTEDYIRELVTLGTQIRSVEHSMERMIIYDRAIAVVPMDPRNSARGALIIRQPSLVMNMVVLFDRIWSDARPVEFGDQQPAEGELASPLEKRILAILANTSKDEIAAREMGMSVRTFRRHVADLMTRLGAANRFQVALLAKSRGWI
jgi:DNA-binding CsgD family transcriptional regulator/sugar-specific transcriptional regulator TrmB